MCKQCISLKVTTLNVIKILREIEVGKFQFFKKYLKTEESQNEFEIRFNINIEF